MDRRRLAALALAIALLETGAVLAIHHSSERANSISVEPGIGEYFVPLPFGADAAHVSAEAAYSRLNGRPAPIPSQVTARYGLLTMPLGPDSHGGIRYQYKDRRVWAFTSPGCTRTAGPTQQTHSETAAVASAPCLHWQFIDALTGQDLGGVG
jgi:hypothetical protein